MQTVKNCAYAWRQMILYLSLANGDETPRFLDWASEHVGKQRADFRQRFAPALAGLQLVATGGRFGSDGLDPSSSGRRFFGWTIGRHWLLSEQRKEESASLG
jgi:hypothetical protein